MKKIKTTLLLLFLGLPFLATAQWSAQVFAGGGPAFETAYEVNQIINSRYEQRQPTLSDFGYTFQGGIYAQYFINQKFGFNIGLGYQYAKSQELVNVSSPNGGLKNWHSESIKIPFNLLWSPGRSHHSVFNLGLATHFNVMKHYVIASNSQTNYQYPVFVSAQLGYMHRLGKRFLIGIQFERDLSWYSKTVTYDVSFASYNYSQANIFDSRYFTSAQIILSYRLFGKDGKKR